MTLKERWKAAAPWNRFNFVWMVMVAGVLVAGVVAGLVEEDRDARLPPSIQERMREVNDRDEAERVRRSREEARIAAARQAQVEAHKAHVRVCIDAATKYLPGLWPSSEAKGKIEADCAEREARSMSAESTEESQ